MTAADTESLPDTSPLVKERHLACSADHAFDTFVGRIGQWWPLAEFSVFGADSRGVVIESGAGGRIVETGPDGQQAVWGTLTDWAPKVRIAHTWHPGHDAAEATLVEVRFTPTETGCTVTLVHHGWNGPGVTASRAGYATGWESVLDAFVNSV